MFSAVENSGSDSEEFDAPGFTGAQKGDAEVFDGSFPLVFLYWADPAAQWSQIFRVNVSSSEAQHFLI